MSPTHLAPTLAQADYGNIPLSDLLQDAQGLMGIVLPSNRHEGYGAMCSDALPWGPPGDTPASIEEAVSRIRGIADSLHAEVDRKENTEIPAGYTYLGQFINHDITFEPFSPFYKKADLKQFENLRSPRLDLDSVYGLGPRVSPHLYSKREFGKLILGRNGRREDDLQRNTDQSNDINHTNEFTKRRTALIGDSRNDENIILGQLHVAFVRFHNQCLREAAGTPDQRFEWARRKTIHYYQHVVVHDYLRTICGQAHWNEIFANPSKPKTPLFDRLNPPGSNRPIQLPLEFSYAAFRMGHSMVRGRYHLSSEMRDDNVSSDNLDPSIFARDDSWGQLPYTLEGGRILPPRWTVEWGRFFSHHECEPPQNSMKMGPHLNEFLKRLPIPGVENELRKLAVRTLLRGYTVGVQCGQSVKNSIEGHAASAGDDPLWVYVLKEAAGSSGDSGAHLGSVGAAIVGQTIAGLLSADPQSLLHAQVAPIKVGRDGARFDMVDFLEYAGVPVTKASWLETVGENPDA